MRVAVRAAMNPMATPIGRMPMLEPSRAKRMQIRIAMRKMVWRMVCMVVCSFDGF
jgi:hypothetical protein